MASGSGATKRRQMLRFGASRGDIRMTAYAGRGQTAKTAGPMAVVTRQGAVDAGEIAADGGVVKAGRSK